MDPHSTELEALKQRVADLERRARRAQGAAIAFLGVAVVAVLLGASPKKGPVEATEFIVRDTAGKVRARLGSIRGLSALFLYDDHERVRAGMSVGATGSNSSLYLYDRGGMIRAGLAVDGSQSSLDLWDRQRRAAVSMMLDESGQGGGLSFLGKDQSERASLGMINGAGRLTLFDRSRAVAYEAPPQQDSSGSPRP